MNDLQRQLDQNHADYLEARYLAVQRALEPRGWWDRFLNWIFH